jgi:hypothetical protein
MIKWMWTFLLGQMDEIEKAESVIAVEMAKNNLCWFSLFSNLVMSSSVVFVGDYRFSWNWNTFRPSSNYHAIMIIHSRLLVQYGVSRLVYGTFENPSRRMDQKISVASLSKCLRDWWKWQGNLWKKRTMVHPLEQWDAFSYVLWGDSAIDSSPTWRVQPGFFNTTFFEKIDEIMR